MSRRARGDPPDGAHGMSLESLRIDGVSREQSIPNAFFPQVGAVRLATEDCVLPGNRVVKKGETVALSHIAFSRDESLSVWNQISGAMLG